jgi:hypothetical protein
MKPNAMLAMAVVVAVVNTGASAQYVWQAREAAQAGPPAATSRASAPLGAGAGLQIFIDPATGLIRPAEQEDLRALARPAAPPEAAMAPQMFFGPEGAIGVRLDPSFDSYMMAVRRPDGTLDFDCIEGRAHPAARQATEIKRTVVPGSKATLDEK